MDRIIGIDYGRKRTGVAVSDPLGVFASALDTVQSAKLLDYLNNYAATQPVSLFVVGWPVDMMGRPSEAAGDVRIFLKHLGKAFPDVPVVLEDERYTSVLAHRAMIDGGMKASDRRDKYSVDRISAAIILQGYLDRVNRGKDGAEAPEAQEAAGTPPAATGEPAASPSQGEAPKPKKRKYPSKG